MTSFVRRDLKKTIDSRDYDERCQLVALAWIGRGDFSREEWDEALEIARSSHTRHTPLSPSGMPPLSDDLEEGLSMFDRSCLESEMGHL